MVASSAVAFHQASVRAQNRTLIEGLVALRPKKRVSKVSWVIFGGCAYFVAALLGDTSVREALFAPRMQARAPQYVATAPVAPRAPIQVRQQPVQLAPAVQVAQAPVVQAPVVVAVPTFAMPPSDPNLNLEPPLPHAKAHHTAPTKRAHSRGTKRTK